MSNAVQEPLCPYCSAPLFDSENNATTREDRLSLSRIETVIVWCGTCHKLLSILPDAAWVTRHAFTPSR
jgi:hypothetical protein